MKIERAALYIADLSKAAAGAPMKISGWASTYDNVDRLGRIWKVGAFGSTLGGQAHSGMDFTAFKLPMLAYHEDDKPVGSSNMQPKADYGMRHESGLADTEFARDMAALIAAGAVPATSIGWDPSTAVWTINAQGFREFTYADIMENTLCPCPANALAILDAASMASSGAAPAWEKEVPAWVKELWPDFARLQFREPEVIDLSRAAASGTKHTHAKVGGGKQTHTHEDATEGHKHEGLMALPKSAETAAGARHSSADQENIQGAHDYLVAAGASCASDSAEASVAIDRNELPDSAFAVVLEGGKEEAGFTVPRSLRKLAYRDEAGNIDRARVEQALTRVESTLGLGDTDRASAKSNLVAAAREVGIPAAEVASLLFSGRGKAAVQGSFEELQEMLSQALRAAYPDIYPWLRATYPDSIVYDIDEALGLGVLPGTYRVAYVIDSDGDVEFGVPEAVVLTQVVQSQPPDTDDDRLVASLELEALEIEAEAALG